MCTFEDKIRSQHYATLRLDCKLIFQDRIMWLISKEIYWPQLSIDINGCVIHQIYVQQYLIFIDTLICLSVRFKLEFPLLLSDFFLSSGKMLLPSNERHECLLSIDIFGFVLALCMLSVRMKRWRHSLLEYILGWIGMRVVRIWNCAKLRRLYLRNENR